MSRTSLELALVGATGVTGEQVLAALDASDVVLGALRAYGSAARSPRVDTVPFRGESVGVEPATALAAAKPDLAVLCVPPAIAAKLAPGLVSRGVVVIDVGNATAGVLAAPLALPGIEPSRDEVARAGAVRTPSSVGALLAAVCAPLKAVGLTGCSAVVNVAASARGRAGIEELGQQVVATLNNQDPQRRVFVDGLAFDTLPEDVPTDEWSSAEQLAADEVTTLCGLPEVVVQVATQPLFAGVSAGLHLRGVTVEDAEDALRGAPGLVAVSRTARLRPRAFLGKPGVAWGRLRADPRGDGVHLWVVSDDLASAGANVVQTTSWLLTAGLLGVA